MDRKTKKVIRLKISKLLDGKCQDCPIQNCDSCEVYKEIRTYAKMIDPTKGREKQETSLTSKIYLQLRKNNIPRNEICEKYGLTQKRLKSLVDSWRQKGEIKRTSKKRVIVSREEYEEQVKNGLNDLQIAKHFGVHHSTIYKKKQNWALNKEQVTKTGALTKEIYLSMKETGMSDLSIAVEIEIDPSTVSYHKKKWGLVK